MPAQSLIIVSDGTTDGTHVYVDGKQLPYVQAIDFKATMLPERHVYCGVLEVIPNEGLNRVTVVMGDMNKAYGQAP